MKRLLWPALVPLAIPYAFAIAALPHWISAVMPPNDPSPATPMRRFSLQRAVVLWVLLRCLHRWLASRAVWRSLALALAEQPLLLIMGWLLDLVPFANIPGTVATWLAALAKQRCY